MGDDGSKKPVEKENNPLKEDNKDKKPSEGGQGLSGSVTQPRPLDAGDGSLSDLNVGASGSSTQGLIVLGNTVGSDKVNVESDGNVEISSKNKKNRSRGKKKHEKEQPTKPTVAIEPTTMEPIQVHESEQLGSPEPISSNTGSDLTVKRNLSSDDGKKNPPKSKKNPPKSKKIKSNEGKGATRPIIDLQTIEHGSDLTERMDALNVGSPVGTTKKNKSQQKKASNAGEKSNQPENQESSPSASISSEMEAFNVQEAEAATKSSQTKNSAEYSLAVFEQVTGLSLTQTSNSNLCLRPVMKSGTIGTSIRLKTNFFKLTLKGGMAYQYDIAFLKPDSSEAVKKEKEVGRKFKRITKRMHQDLLKAFVSSSGSRLFEGISYAYDNDRIMVTNRPLDAIDKSGSIFSFTMNETVDEGKVVSHTYSIRIKRTVDVALNQPKIGSLGNLENCRHLLQIIDIISKTWAFQNDVIYGSKIFPADKARTVMMSGRNGERTTPYELAFGYHQSTQVTQSGPMQIIDSATAVMFKAGPLISSICDLLNKGSPGNIVLDYKTHNALSKFSSLRVVTHYRGFSCNHTIKSFTPKSARETKFTIDGKPKSVEDYFREAYSIELVYPNLPCIVYGNNIFVPAELCDLLPNQRYPRKLDEEIIRIVSKHATKRPIQRSLELMKNAEDISSQLKQQAKFGIELSPTQVTVNSRVLPAPTLKYGKDHQYRPEQGDWTMQIKGNTMRNFANAGDLQSWDIVLLDNRRIGQQVIDEFAKQLKNNAAAFGMRLADPQRLVKRTLLVKELEWFFGMAAKNGLKLVVVVMPEISDLYSQVKLLGDQKYSIPTQVVLDKHYDTRYGLSPRQKIFTTAYLSNLLLKINTKIGGTNLKLSDAKIPILNKDTMVVGIDVNHPSPGENARSIAAVVGSIDGDFMKYRTEIVANKERDELVKVDEMLPSILQAFKAKNGSYPKHIIVYRDGVSEGQFAAVMRFEILELHKKLEKDFGSPKLTYIIVQKRHNARFFPVQGARTTKSGNMLPGSVVDTDVCHYKWFDFYLCSQNSFLGTARPGKYTVLWDSCHASADDIQMATYYLCYLFARSTKSIADPAPARYAHHAAARGKIHFREMTKMKKLTDKQINAEINRAINVNEDFKNILYFI